ncbi:uncharacterized protein [Medicago truncatula]|nr:uncharacterized protein LOC25490607 isoform X3 [Medicago truncatula]
MASFLTDLAKPCVDKLINGAITESSYICCFTCIAKDFEEERARLEIEKTTVMQRVDVATRRGEDVQGNALFWEKEADKLIQEDTKTNQRCLFGFCPRIIWQYRRGKELTNKNEQIRRLIETGKELSIGLPARLPDVERYSSQHYIPFKSRESRYKELLDSLKDDNNYVIGLKGMGGTGKTTLAKEVGKELKQSKKFTYVIDTTMSLSFNISKIQDDIAGPLGLKFNDCSESDRPKKLWSRLTNGEKILLILDDVWGDINFVEIGIPQSGDHNGCRILITTRSMLVCNKLECSKTVQLELLSEEDAWTMFKRHAGLSKNSTKIFLDKGRKIANECKRLPIAIAVIASSLKGIQRPEEWEWALNSVQKHMPMHDVHDDDDHMVKIYECLQFSYHNMKDEKAKRLFLLCSVFREDEAIPIERLIRFGIGVGLLGEVYGSYENARSQVVISKNKLLDSCLLLEANQNSVKMHDLVRDAAQWIAKKEIQTVKLYDKNQKAMVEREMNIRYLLCEGKLKDLFSFKLDGSKVEILIVNVHKDKDCHNVKIEVPNSFFENSAGLRIFHLISPRFSKLYLSLPLSIQSLKNIRSLLFTHVFLGDISILGNLQSLETLDLDDCDIDELPHGITKLDKLKLLNLTNCRISRNNPFEVIEGCSSLEDLYFRGSFNGFCREITFPKLQRFYIDDQFCSSVDELSSKCVFLKVRIDIFLSETTLKYCMQEAEVLKLRRIEGGWRNIIPDIVPLNQGMNDLVELQLQFISQLRCLIDTKHIASQVPNVFSMLVVLDLWRLENLKELFNGPLSFDSLNSLEKLSIKDCKHLQSLFKCNLNLFNLKSVSLEKCPMLMSLFHLSTAVSLVLLERLEIEDCGCLEYIIDERKGEESRGEIVDDNDNTSHGAMLQNLKVLNIKNCPRIELILAFHSAHDLPALESITIEHCDKVKYIFDQDLKLGSLKQFKLHGIPNLIDIFPECNRTMSFAIKEASSISGYASQPQEKSDPIKCNIFSWTNVYCWGKKNGHKLRSTTSNQFQVPDNLMESNSYPLNIWERAQCLSRPALLCNVEEITLKNVSKMKSVFILSTKSRMLLKTLKVLNCDELRYIIIIDTRDHHESTSGNNWGTVFPKLTHVEVEDCEQLEYIIVHDDHLHFQLPELEWLSLWNLPSLVGMCPKQYYTTAPTLKGFQLHKCTQFNIKSIGDCITHHSLTRSLNNTIIKELSGDVEHFRALETLNVNKNSKVESIFCLNERNEQQMNLALEEIILGVLPMMTYLFVGPKNSFSLQNLTDLTVKRCEKLIIVFSNSIIRCLPQLRHMRIEECKELTHIFEDDLENKKSSNFMSTTKTCFPKLRTLAVQKCNKLLYVFPISICKELPELEGLMIREAYELEEIFGSEGDEKVNIPKLKVVAFVNLPSLCQAQGIQFQAVKHRFIRNCQKLSLASATTADLKNDIRGLLSFHGFELHNDLTKLFDQLHDEPEGHDKSSEITFVQTASRHKLTSSQKEMEQTIETEHEFVENVPRREMPSVAVIQKISDQLAKLVQQHELGETDATVKPSQENNVEGSTLSATSETTNELPIQLVALKRKALQKHLILLGNEISVEEGTTSANAKRITSAAHSKSVNSSLSQLATSKHKTTSQEDGDVQIAIASPPIATQDVDVEIWQETRKTNDDQVSLNDDDVVKVSSNIEDQFPKNDEILVSKSIPSCIASQYPSKPTGEDPSQKEDFSSSLFVKRELDQLVSKKHFDYENLSFLTDFFVKHPSILLKDTSLSNRYKGYAYNCLAELLKFLQTRSVLDVLGSSNSEFVELLQDVRRFPFDKKWLDGVEKRALFPGLQVSQDALQKLLDSKHILTQHVMDLKHQLDSSEAVLQNITQQEAQILQTRAALSDPIGY